MVTYIIIFYSDNIIIDVIIIIVLLLLLSLSLSLSLLLLLLLLLLAIPVGDAYGIVDIHFFFFFFLFFSFFPPLLSGPYLWNRYSQRLQIQCAAWSCSLVLHYCLPSNSLCYFFFFLIFFFFSATILSGPYLWNRYSQRLQIECAAWSCGVILHYYLLSNSLRFFFFFFFPPRFCHDFVRAISLEPLLAETPNWVCCLVLQSNCALLFTIQFALLVFFFF